MRNMILSAAIIAGVGLTACTKQNNTDLQAQNSDTTITKVSDMKSLISIVEIPAENFSRAVSFYETILDIHVEPVEMEGIKMGLFPNGDERISVQLIHGGGYKPSADGTVVYFNGGDDLQKIADKIVINGGKIVIPKTEIGPEMGYYAIFTDTEGNKLGLHSLH